MFEVPVEAMKSILRRAALCAVFCVAIQVPAESAATLYDRLGGTQGVHAIADALIDRAAADPVMGRSFADVNLKRVKRLLAEQICELSGGPCRYSGSSMREAHAGLHISQAEFYDLVDTLRQVLSERRVPLGARNELLRLLAAMKRDVIEAGTTGH
jgi:hemoglobin